MLSQADPKKASHLSENTPLLGEITAAAPSALYGFTYKGIIFCFLISFTLIAITGRFLNAFGSYNSEQDTIREWLDLILIKFKFALEFFKILEHMATITYCSGNGFLNAFSEGHKLFGAAINFKNPSKKSDLIEPTRAPKHIHIRSFLLAFFNAVTTGAAAFNGTQIVLHCFKLDKIGLHVLGGIFGGAVFGSSAYYNYKKQIDLYHVQAEIKTRKNKFIFYSTAGVSLITNAAFSAYQVLNLLKNYFGLDQNRMSTLAITATMAAFSDGNLFFSQIPATKKVLADSENTVLSNLEEERAEHSASPAVWHISRKCCASITYRCLWQVGNILMHSAYLFTPFNTPAGIRDLATVFCEIGVNVSKKGNCDIISDKPYYYSNLVLGTLFGIPAAINLRSYRLRDAQRQYIATLDTAFRKKPSPIQPEGPKPCNV